MITDSSPPRDQTRPLGSAVVAASSTAKDRAGDLVDTASSVVDQAKDSAAEIGREAMDAVEKLADTQKQTGAQLMQTIAKAADAAASQLAHTAPEIAQHVRDAARGLEHFGQDFENKSVSDLMETFTGFAKREPALLLAGSVIAGFVLTRFIKTSADADSGTSAAPDLEAASAAQGQPYRPDDMAWRASNG